MPDLSADGLTTWVTGGGCIGSMSPVQDKNIGKKANTEVQFCHQPDPIVVHRDIGRKRESAVS